MNISKVKHYLLYFILDSNEWGAPCSDDDGGFKSWSRDDEDIEEMREKSRSRSRSRSQEWNRRSRSQSRKSDMSI